MTFGAAADTVARTAVIVTSTISRAHDVVTIIDDIWNFSHLVLWFIISGSGMFGNNACYLYSFSHHSEAGA